MYIWRRPRKASDTPARVLGTKDAREKVMSKFHDSEWAGHRGIWASFSKIQERYWCPNMYKDNKYFVETCDLCQKYSSI
jgi:hypothetical protein